MAQQLSVLGKTDKRLWPAPFVCAAPGPGVAKPKGWQDVEDRPFWTAIRRSDPDQNVVRRCLGVLHEDVEVTSFVEDATVEELELCVQLAAAAVLFKQTLIRELRLGVLVKRFQVRVRRRGIEIEVALLAIFTMIALRPGQAEKSFLEN